MLLIDLINDLQVSRQQLLHQFHRPALQGLWEHCVVGIGEGFLGDLPGLQEERVGSCAFSAHSHSTSQCPQVFLCSQAHSIPQRPQMGQVAELYFNFFSGKEKAFYKTIIRIN